MLKITLLKSASSFSKFVLSDKDPELFISIDQLDRFDEILHKVLERCEDNPKHCKKVV